MQNILIYIFIFSFIFSSDLKINVYPDTIYVGSLVNITLSVENNAKEEVFIFYDIDEDLDKYTLLDKKLSQNSVEYILQFWNEGLIIIPSIPVDIKRDNLDIMRLETEEINIHIWTNIVNSDNKMRDIKPMKEFELTSSLNKILFLITLLLGGWFAILLWNTKRIPKYSNYSQETFIKSNMEDSIKQIEELPLPEKINSLSTEKYYLALSNICRSFLKELLYIKATEMTSDELIAHFNLIGVEKELVNSWKIVCNTSDMAKYAKQIPHIEQFNIDKNNFINIIRSFHRISSYTNSYS